MDEEHALGDGKERPCSRSVTSSLRVVFLYHLTSVVSLMV